VISEKLDTDYIAMLQALPNGKREVNPRCDRGGLASLFAMLARDKRILKSVFTRPKIEFRICAILY